MSPPNKHTIRPKRRSESPKEHLLRTLLGAKGIATRSKDATRGSWPYYWEQEATRSFIARARARGERTSRAASDGFADGFADPDCKRKNSGLVQPLHHAISEEWIKVDGRS